MFCSNPFLFLRYLQNNQFTGHINVLANLPLETLWVINYEIQWCFICMFSTISHNLLASRNVANNHFTGWIPSQLKKINSLQWVFLTSWHATARELYLALIHFLCIGLMEILGAQDQRHRHLHIQHHRLLQTIGTTQVRMVTVHQVLVEDLA